MHLVALELDIRFSTANSCLVYYNCDNCLTYSVYKWTCTKHFAKDYLCFFNILFM